MRALGIVVPDERGDSLLCFVTIGIGPEIDFFVLDRAKEALHNDIVDPKTETLSTLSVSFRQRVPDQFSTSAVQTGWKACCSDGSGRVNEHSFLPAEQEQRPCPSLEQELALLESPSERHKLGCTPGQPEHKHRT